MTEKARDEPFLATVVLGNGDGLAIGLGDDETVLAFVAGTGDPPYYVSRGPRETDEPPLDFLYGGEWSEFPRRNAIPVALAREGMRTFVLEGRLPDFVGWEEA